MEMVKASRPDKPSCFCPACTVAECRIKKEGKRKMEKFKKSLTHVACIILPPIMLMLLILGIAAIISWGFHNIETKENQTQVKQGVQTVQKVGKKVWLKIENWANEE